MTITVYTKPHCQQCRATQRKLTKLGLNYTEVDISAPENKEIYDTFISRGFKQAPIVEIPEKNLAFSGYHPEILNTLI